MTRVEPGIPSQPLVLIVDDDEDTRQLYVEALGLLGFDTIGVADCQQARQRAYHPSPDVVVTDLTPRDNDGWQLIQELISDLRTRDVPVVLLTGDAQRTSRARAAQAGCAGYVVKPCLPDELAAELRHVLSETIHEGLSTSR
jgi:two-component system, cell cycle response regulator DivK